MSKLDLVDNLISELGLSRNEVVAHLQKQPQQQQKSKGGDHYPKRSEYEEELYRDMGGDVDDFI